MEIVIVISLLIIIALLVKDKFSLGRALKQEPGQGKVNPELPDIMGQPKTAKGYSRDRNAKMNTMTETEAAAALLPATKRQKKDIKTKAAATPPAAINLEEEERGWGGQGLMPNDNFAIGVTFDELATVGKLLAQKKIKRQEKAIALSIASKIEGTSLMGLLESRMADASRKIAVLLDKRIAGQGTDENDANDEADFNISDFV